jgi:hypothetical protein
MGIGASIFLLAVGAILTFAVEWTVQGVDLDAVGIILMIAGCIGLAVTLAMMSRTGGTRVTEYSEDPTRRPPPRGY